MQVSVNYNKIQEEQRSMNIVAFYKTHFMEFIDCLC